MKFTGILLFIGMCNPQQERSYAKAFFRKVLHPAGIGTQVAHSRIPVHIRQQHRLKEAAHIAGDLLAQQDGVLRTDALQIHIAAGGIETVRGKELACYPQGVTRNAGFLVGRKKDTLGMDILGKYCLLEDQQTK